MAKKKKPLNSVTIEEKNKPNQIEFDGNDKFRNQFEKYNLKIRAIDRLTVPEFWDKFGKYFRIRSIDNFCIDALEQVKVYISALQGQVNSIMHSGFSNQTSRELRRIKRTLELKLRNSGRLRFELKTQESRINGIIKSIENSLESLGEKSPDIFSHPKPENIQENIICQYCGREIKNHSYGMPCPHCKELISDPWREHTICPKCSRLINRSEIFSDKIAFELNSSSNTIRCPNCSEKFNWKEHIRDPQGWSTKICVSCDQPYSPDKRNWKKQRICPECKARGVDSFYIDNPKYQRVYREKKK